MKEDGGPPARGMSRSDKGSAGSGEDGKTTSGQEGLQPVDVRADCFSVQIERSSILALIINKKIKSSKSSDLLLLVTRTRIELVIPP